MKAKNKLLMVFTFTLATLSLNAQEQKVSKQEPVKKAEAGKHTVTRKNQPAQVQRTKPVQKFDKPELKKVSEKEVREKQ